MVGKLVAILVAYLEIIDKWVTTVEYCDWQQRAFVDGRREVYAAENYSRRLPAVTDVLEELRQCDRALHKL